METTMKKVCLFHQQQVNSQSHKLFILVFGLSANCIIYDILATTHNQSYKNFSELQARMYPKVKVRAHEADDASSHLCYFGLKNKKASPGLTSDKTRKNSYSSSSAASNKAKKIQNTNSSLPHKSPSTGRSSKNETKNGNDGQISKTGDRANSILRPRAVLSSPVNDKKIGKMNRLNRIRPLTEEQPDLKRKSSPAQASSIKNSKVKPASPLGKKAGSSSSGDITIIFN